MGDLPRVARLAEYDLLVAEFGILCLKWRLPTRQVGNEHAEAPNVDLEGMAGASYDFRSNILRGSAISQALLPIVLKLPGKPEIDQLHMASLPHREYDILWLQVSINYILFVQKL